MLSEFLGRLHGGLYWTVDIRHWLIPSMSHSKVLLFMEI